MTYPLISEYISSILDAEDNFATLTTLRPLLDKYNQPIMTSGNFAVVFKMVDANSNKLYAVKCFTKEQKGRNIAYKRIVEELNDLRSSYFMHVEYLEKELFVDSKNASEEDFPVVVMDWVEGVTLDKYISENIDNSYNLNLLAYNFSKLGSYLLSQDFAHGDLKPDNILVDDKCNITLVDYDGMFFPSMEGMKSRELGSPSFRHPERTINDFNSTIDDFAIIVIALSLKIISCAPKLYTQYGTPDSLLLNQNDFLEISSEKMVRCINPLLNDKEVALLWGLFLIVLSSKNLNNVNHNILKIKKISEDSSTHSSLSDIFAECKKNGDFKLIRDICNNNIRNAQNLGESYLWLGLSYQFSNSELKEKDQDNMILELITKSVQHENALAMVYLGSQYLNGWIIGRDYKKAFELYSKAYEKGEDRAIPGLSQCYYYGYGTSINIPKTLELVIEGSNKNIPYSQFMLGHWYDHGSFEENGTIYNTEHRDKAKAILWYTRAGQQNHKKACHLVSLIYKFNKDFANVILAKYWIELANTNSNVGYGINFKDDFDEDKMEVIESRNLNKYEKEAIESARIISNIEKKLEIRLKGLSGSVCFSISNDNLYEPNGEYVNIDEVLLVSYKNHYTQTPNYPEYYKIKLWPY